MGRKIKGRHHHGVRDPEAQRLVREAKFINKINAAPGDIEDQGMPRRMMEISEFMSKDRHSESATSSLKKKLKVPELKKSNKKPPPQKRKKLLDSGPVKIKAEGEMGKKPLASVPRFTQNRGESEYHFFQRINRKVTEVINKKSYEKKFNVEVKEDPVTGKNIIKSREKDEVELAKEEKRRKKIMKKKGIHIRTKEEKLEHVRSQRKLRKLKKKGKLPKGSQRQNEDDDSDEDNNNSNLEDKFDENRLRDFSELTDKVAFNEVVHAPPSLSHKANKKIDMSLMDPEARRPASKDGLLVKSMLNSGQRVVNKKKSEKSSTLSLAQKEILERERMRVIEQYRALKKQRFKEKP